ncbi:MAG TPA: hypothetical protein VHC94_05545, partial [Nitrobacter sp.]|nr:hypothetical protein [Nitrobacter sp.]
IASGRGVTAWGLEISPNKACEHAHQILADSAVNNEIALYGKLAAAFLKNSDDILDKKIEGQGSEVTPRNKELFARMAEAQEAMGRMADARVAMFQAINDGCLKRMSDSEAAISWQTAFLAFGYALLLFFFANTIVKALFKIGRE